MHTKTSAIQPAINVYHILLTVFCLLILSLQVNAAEIPIVVSGEPKATVQIGANASTQEQFAASELQNFIEKFTGAQLELRTNQQSTTTQTVIVLGTPTSNPRFRTIQEKVGFDLPDEIGEEGYQI